MLTGVRFPTLRQQTNVAATGSTTPRTSFATGAASTSKTATPVQVIASTDFDVHAVRIAFSGVANSTSDSQFAADLMVGASTAEEVIWGDIIMGGSGGYGGVTGVNGPSQSMMPLYIPAGERLSVRAASNRTAVTMYCQIWLYGGTHSPRWPVGSRVTTYGIGTLPAGTTITPGASGAQGSWTQITASSTYDHTCWMPGFQGGLDTTKQLRGYTVGVGFGAATEQEIATWSYWQNDLETAQGMFPCWWAEQHVPSGTRLGMRASSSGTLDGGSYNGVIYAI